MTTPIRLVALLASLIAGAPAIAAEPPIAWKGWSHDVFVGAAAEKRFVILDLEAVWCHWCHVMDQKTYGDDRVRALIAARYVPVRVDQDANPDLANRYGDWGWPATIIFAPDGSEIAKVRGYLEPERMASLLQAVIDDPTPGPSVVDAFVVKPSTSAFLSKDARSRLATVWSASFDEDNAGWGDGVKYIDADSLDYAVALAETGDRQAETRARRTLDAAFALIDPVWGGVYQYSDKADWRSPHFEKIMSFQAQYLRQYAEAYARWRDPKYLAAAKSIEAYLTSWLLGPDGAFYVSQDADLDHHVDGHEYYALDDAGRRRMGVPRVDTHVYARENGWAIAALAAYANATGDDAPLAAAERAARWIQANRGLPGGGFRHDAADRAGPYLGDTLAMAQGFVELYAATGDRDWLTAARASGDFIAATFTDEAGGYLTSKTAEAKGGAFAKPVKPIDEQTAVARLMNRLARYAGDDRYRGFAAHAMRYLAGAAPEMLRPLPGVLLADRELAAGPTHLTIVGHKDDPAAQALQRAARMYPASYKRIDWWDTREGRLPNPDIDYPELDRAAAFACGDRTCSLPAFSAEELSEAVAAMARSRPARNAER